MRQKRTFILAAAVGRGVALACEALLVTGGFEFLENRSFDLRVRLLPPPEPPPADIVIVDIDNPSFAALSEAVGLWPWTRLLWADLAKFIQQGQPRAIVFDAVFSGREDEEVDREFAQALAQSGNVILAYAFVAYEAERAGGAAGAPRAVPGAVAVEDKLGLPALSARSPPRPIPTASTDASPSFTAGTTATTLRSPWPRPPPPAARSAAARPRRRTTNRAGGR